MDCYIISYFGKSQDTQHYRQALHYVQLCSVLRQEGIENIHILAQNYHDDKIVTRPKDYLYMPHPRIHYHTAEKQSPASARNRLMDIFNKTNKPWALFLDNDGILDPRWHGAEIVPHIEANGDALAKRCSLLSVMSPRHQPFTGYLEENAEVLRTHIPLYKQNYCKTTAFFLRNETLYGNEPIYFDESLTNLEDFAYTGEVLSRGNAIYQIKSVIMNDMGLNENGSTLFEDDDRRVYFEDLKMKIYKKYMKYGLKRSQDGKTLFWNRMRGQDILPTNLFINKEKGGVDEFIATPHFNSLFDYD